MAKNDDPIEIKMDYKVPVVAADNSIVLTKNGAYELAFLQFNRPNEPIADVVSAVRVNSLEALADLRNTIDEHIRKEKNKEK
jgi:hypothetical protein